MTGHFISGAKNGHHPEMGLALFFDTGWYTYWRMPGDNGLPPTFDWSQSENVKDVQVSWPAPKRFTTEGMHSFGYDDSVVFPLTVTPVASEKPVQLKLKLEMVVCHDICIPATLIIDQTKEDAASLKKARTLIPAKENTKILGIDTAVLGKTAVVVKAFAKNGFETTDMIIEAEGVSLTSAPEILLDETDNHKAIIKISASEGYDLAKALFGKPVTITLINGGEAVERSLNF